MHFLVRTVGAKTRLTLDCLTLGWTLRGSPLPEACYRMWLLSEDQSAAGFDRSENICREATADPPHAGSSLQRQHEKSGPSVRLNAFQS